MVYVIYNGSFMVIYNFYLVKFMDIYYDIKLFLIFIGYYILIIMMINYNIMMMLCYEKRY